MTWRERVLDPRPLRASRTFREIWAGSLVSTLGLEIAAVTVLYQVWQLTRSPVWTGAIGLAIAVPLLVSGLVGGWLADTYDRRTVVRVATVGQVLAAAGLLTQALLENPSVTWILALVGAQAAFGGLGAPTRRILPARLLPAHLVAGGIALMHLSWQAMMLVGPALAGLVLGAWGPAAGYGIQAATGVVGLLVVLRLPPLPPQDEAGSDAAPRPASAARRRRAAPGGWSAVWSRPTIRGSLLTDLVATVLAMPIALFPLINEVRFGGAPETLGLFLSAVAVGGIGMGLVSGTVTRARRAGLVQLGAAFVWGLSLVVFGLVGPVWLALTALVVAGAADTVSVVTRADLVLHETPDRFRGRVSSVEHVIGVAGPHLGSFRGGVLASLTSASTSLAVGGAMAAAGVLMVAVTHPALRAYRGRAGAPASGTDGRSPGDSPPESAWARPALATVERTSVVDERDIEHEQEDHRDRRGAEHRPHPGRLRQGRHRGPRRHHGRAEQGREGLPARFRHLRGP